MRGAPLRIRLHTMTINILRGRSGKPKEARPPDAIGEPDANVFSCPKCARPLANGTPKCPSCGQRLILGVALRRASLLAGFGLIVGVFGGAVLTSGVITSLLRSAAAAVSAGVATVTPTTAPSPVPTNVATAAPVATPPPVVAVTIPSAAMSALGQTTILDARIVADATDLDAALAAKSTADIARTLRALASDAANGTVQAGRLKTWSEAGTVAAFRLDFYDRVTNHALGALKVTLSDGKAYRKAAAGMLVILADLPGLDAMSRGLASAASLDLPVVDFGILTGG